MDHELDDFANDCALRFDYHRWCDENPDRAVAADEYSDRCIEEQKILDADLHLKMGSLYQLQRALKKYSLVQEPRESPYYWAFYELTLETCRRDVPEDLRTSLHADWAEYDDIEAWSLRLRKAHEATDYDWDRGA